MEFVETSSGSSFEELVEISFQLNALPDDGHQVEPSDKTLHGFNKSKRSAISSRGQDSTWRSLPSSRTGRGKSLLDLCPICVYLWLEPVLSLPLVSSP